MAFWNQKKKRKKLIRNLVTLLTVVTNCFIIAGVSRHWIIKPRHMILRPFIPHGTHDDSSKERGLGIWR